jgi:hypothetical protein
MAVTRGTGSFRSSGIGLLDAGRAAVATGLSAGGGDEDRVPTAGRGLPSVARSAEEGGGRTEGGEDGVFFAIVGGGALTTGGFAGDGAADGTTGGFAGGGVAAPFPSLSLPPLG